MNRTVISEPSVCDLSLCMDVAEWESRNAIRRNRMTLKRSIDTERFSAFLRPKAISAEEKLVSITRFNGAEQERDLTVPANCGGYGRIHHFHRDQGDSWPSNPLPIDPALSFLGLADADSIDVQVFQLSICAWRCWYCFVDFDRLSGDPTKSKLLSASDLLDLYSQEAIRPPIIDLSGGQPDLVPEWSLWFTDEVRSRGLHESVYLWSDDNLSNDYMFRHLTPAEISRLAAYKNYGRVGCFKGFDPYSFAFNTGADCALFANQFDLMRRLVDAGFDVYGYATFTSDRDDNIRQKVRDFVDQLQTKVHPLFPLRTVPLRIRPYSPTLRRMRDEHFRALEIQMIAVAAWSEELRSRFSSDCLSARICRHGLR